MSPKSGKDIAGRHNPSYFPCRLLTGLMSPHYNQNANSDNMQRRVCPLHVPSMCSIEIEADVLCVPVEDTTRQCAC